ncbi:MAG: hypothetical protein WCT39_05535 [Candidatus Margulisiibacteriota bacterium]
MEISTFAIQNRETQRYRGTPPPRCISQGGRLALTHHDAEKLDVFYFYPWVYHDSSEAHQIMDATTVTLNDLCKVTPFIPKEFVILLFDSPHTDCRKIRYEDMIQLRMRSTFHTDNLLHETGHVIFNKVDSFVWRLIYYYSLGGNERFNLVKDSSYTPGWEDEVPKRLCREETAGACVNYTYKKPPKEVLATYSPGHPWDSPTELFASSFHAFVVFPDEFAKRILDPNTSQDVALLGKLLWLYLRDEVFLRTTFLINDPFQSENVHDLLAEISVQEISQDLKQLNPAVSNLLSRPNRDRGNLGKIADWLNQYGKLTIKQLSHKIGWKTFPEVFFIRP